MITILEIFENMKNIRLNDIASNSKFSMLESDRIELIEFDRNIQRIARKQFQ